MQLVNSAPQKKFECSKISTETVSIYWFLKKKKSISYGEHAETQGNLICIKTIGFLQAKPVSNTILTSSIFLPITTYIK